MNLFSKCDALGYYLGCHFLYCSYHILMSFVINNWTDPQQNGIHLLKGCLQLSCIMKLLWGIASFAIQHWNKFSTLSHNNNHLLWSIVKVKLWFLHRTFSDGLQVAISLLPHHLNYQHIQVWSSPSHFLLGEIKANNLRSYVSKHTYTLK